MADLIISILTPVVVSMGASAADVANYVHAVEPQINIILIVDDLYLFDVDVFFPMG